MDETGSAPQRGIGLRPRFGLPRLTPFRGIALIAGAVVVQTLRVLPPDWIALTLAGLALLLLFVRVTCRAPVWFAFGFAWTLVCAASALHERLPTDLQGLDFEVIGTIRGLPSVETRNTRFEFNIESATLDGEKIALSGTSRLNWYDDAPALAPCSQWKLRLRLRPPRGLVNPGGYDGERGSVQRGVAAVGYVRGSAENQQIASAQGLCIDGWRQAITQSIAQRFAGQETAGLLRALAVGDQHGIAESDWQVLRATGIGHLIAISGLHVGMFAAFGALLARGIWKTWPHITLRIPGPLLEAPVALVCAFGYGLLAGMGVPTIRTLLMIAIALLARNARRASSIPQALALAAVIIVIWNPLAVLSAGFWLSFFGVAVLLSITQPTGTERAWWREIPRLQLVLSLALLPMTVWFFGQGSLIGPLANLVAVPWVSFLVVPLTVAGSLLIVDLPMIGGPLLDLADLLLRAVWSLMQWLAALPSAQVYFAAAPSWAFILALIGVAWCLLPRGVPARALGLVLLIPLLIPPRTLLAQGEFEVWMFDVGQGLSIFVRTGERAMLYDAGPRYPSGFDIGDAVVIPSLHALGVDRLDRMVISHGDNDHAGGAEAVHLAYPEAVIESGEPERMTLEANACHERESWRWDGVDFRVVSAVTGPSAKSNDHSCVVLVSGSFGSLLLTGDATTQVEPAVADSIGEVRHPLVLTVPHHGSKTASSAAFLDAIDPQLALVSTGYRNHFGHPHADVIARMSQRSIPLLNTANSGYLHLRFASDSVVPEQGREVRQAWWRVN